MSSTPENDETQTAEMERYASVSRMYDSAFVLDRSKLSRIGSIVENAAERIHARAVVKIEVELSSEKNITVASLDDLFRLDNSVHDPIRELKLRFLAVGTEHRFSCSLDFEIERHGIYEHIDVHASESKLAQELFAEVEEQIERTLQRGLIYRLKSRLAYGLLPLFLGAVFAGLGAGTTGTQACGVNSRAISPDAASKLLMRAEQVKSPDDRLALLFDAETARLKSVVDSQTSFATMINKAFSVRGLMLEVPLLLVAISLLYLVVACYPKAVFSWGDMEHHYANVIGRRRLVWNAVVFAFVVGVVGNLFVMGLAPYLKL